MVVTAEQIPHEASIKRAPGEASSGVGGFGEGVEFVVGVGEGEKEKKVRGKAFVPEWLRRGLVCGKGHKGGIEGRVVYIIVGVSKVY